MHRVVITGMGVISPVGTGVEEFFENLCQGKNGIDYIEGIEGTDHPDFKIKVAGQVKNFAPEQYMDKREVRRMDRVTQFAMAAAELCVRNGEVDFSSMDRDRIGVLIGSGIGGICTLEKELARYNEKGPRRVSALTIPMLIANMPAAMVSMRYQLHGDCLSEVTACATATHCIGEAFHKIKDGYLDMALAGGAEASITGFTLSGFANMTALSTSEDKDRASIPFDKERNGFVMGEGGGVLCLESLEHALARGAKIMGEVVGYGSTADAYHITSPDPEGTGAARAMRMAVEEAGITPNQVDYINAHGTSTGANDKTETMAIHKAFGEHAADLLVNSTKSMTGHLLGAAGAVEAIACALQLEHGVVHPTIGYRVPDEECDLNYCTQGAVHRDIRYALSNSLGFGGHNATLLLKKYEG
ncbi:MAG: beta-ketoacyl-ACP synthase II [Eubacteriales bacterium]|jgi:3-oxoacyl-[acyl-carrier-protein] synthase II